MFQAFFPRGTCKENLAIFDFELGSGRLSASFELTNILGSDPVTFEAKRWSC